MFWLVSRQGLVFSVFVLASILNLFFGFFRFLNFLGIRYIYSYAPRIVSVTIFSSSVDLWVWAVSLVVLVLQVLFLVALRGRRFSRWLVLPCALVLFLFSILGVESEAASLFAVPMGFALVILSEYFLLSDVEERRWIFCFTGLGLVVLGVFFEFDLFLSWILGAFGNGSQSSSFWLERSASVDVGLFYAFYPLTSWLFVVFLYCWVWIPVGRALLIRASSLRPVFSRFWSGASLGSGRLDRKFLFLGLLLIVVSAVFVAYYPYFRLSDNVLVGSDSVDYSTWLKGMMVNGTSLAWQSDRPLVLLLLAGFQGVTGLSAMGVVMAMPILCAVCMCLAVLWFVRVCLKNDILALGAAFLSVVSFQLTVSINAYFLANWMALILAFTLFGLLLKSLEERSRRY
ncbi:MAG: hypothetical protein QG670_1947, partial [Thermoproteota archaeon]|nr:hypothetical protein [Thermoproteota archaeon]